MPSTDRVALIATILLALATVATAWSGYQASRWNGEATKATARGNAARVESTRQSDLANSLAQVDLAVFTQWVDAYARDETLLRDFYFKRFRAEFKPAVVAVDRDEAAEEPERAAQPVRHAAVHVRRRGTRRTSSRRTRTHGQRRRGRTSSARPTTCSGSSCSPPRCSSPA